MYLPQSKLKPGPGFASSASSAGKSKSKITAMQILQREESNNKKTRLISLLILQMTSKYGTKQKSAINSMIEEEIVKFIESFQNINDAEKNLQGFEIKIQDKVSKLKSLDTKNSMDNLSVSKNEPVSNTTNDKTVSPKTVTPKMNEFSAKDWLVFNAIIDVNDEEHDRQAKEQARLKQKSFRQVLDQQVNHIKASQQQSKIEKEIEHKKLTEEEEKLKREQESLKYAKSVEFSREREIRLQQIEYNKMLREKEKQDRTISEQIEIARTQKLIEKEEELKRQKKEAEKRRQDLIIEENEKNKAIRSEMKRQQHELDIKLAKEYELRMQREEEARARAFQQRYETLQRTGLKYESQAGVEIRKKEKKEEERTNAAVEERNRLAAKREADEIEHRRLEIEKSKKANQELLRAKEEARQRERMESYETRLQMERESEEVARKEAAKKEAKRLEMLRMKATYDKQLQEHAETERRKEALSETELSLNKSLLRRLEEDPVLSKKVYEKINPGNLSKPKENNVLCF